MDLDQEEEPFRFLDVVAKEATVALTRANIRHGFMGGHAVSLIGGSRMTEACIPCILT